MKSISKVFRQRAVVDIVSKNSIPNQIALAQELQKRGFDVTQATVSRDIKDLDLLKTKGGYQRPNEAELGQSGLVRMDCRQTLRRAVTGVIHTSNMVVIKTAAGCAQPVALALDSGEFEEIIGTVGGDDTVFAAVRSRRDALSLKSKILDSLR